MAEKGIWLSTQPFIDEGDEGSAAQLGPMEQAKMRAVVEGTDTVYKLAKKYHLKTAFGTDILFSAAAAEQQGNWLTRLTRWYTPAEALIMATSTNAELLTLSGLRNPYPGKLGVVEEGALADLILVDGNPLETSRSRRRRRQEFRRHHERREDLQEHPELTMTFSACRSQVHACTLPTVFA